MHSEHCPAPPSHENEHAWQSALQLHAAPVFVFLPAHAVLSSVNVAVVVMVVVAGCVVGVVDSVVLVTVVVVFVDVLVVCVLVVAVRVVKAQAAPAAPSSSTNNTTVPTPYTTPPRSTARKCCPGAPRRPKRRPARNHNPAPSSWEACSRQLNFDDL